MVSTSEFHNIFGNCIHIHKKNCGCPLRSKPDPGRMSRLSYDLIWYHIAPQLPQHLRESLGAVSIPLTESMIGRVPVDWFHGAIEACVRHGETDILTLLFGWIDSGKIPPHALNVNELLTVATECEYDDIMLILIERGGNIRLGEDKVLRIAAKTGNVQLVQLALMHHACVSRYDHEALRLAAGFGHLEVVELLLTVPETDVHALDDHAVRWAVSGGYSGVVEALVAGGADVRALNDDAIMRAAEGGHLPLVKWLLGQGAQCTDNVLLVDRKSVV